MANIDFGSGANTPTGDTVAQALAKLQARLDALGTPAPAPRILAAGDSQTAHSDSLPTYFDLFAGENPTLAVMNEAVAGSALSQTGNLNPTNRKPAALAFAPTIVSMLLGANEMMNYPTAQAFIDAELGYLAEFRSGGALTVLVTVPPRQANGYTAAQWETRRGQVNAIMRTLVGTQIDALVDLDKTAMGVAGAQDDTGLYFDGLHPAAAGQGIIKNIYAPVIRWLAGIGNQVQEFAFAPQANAVAGQSYDSPAYKVKGLGYGETKNVTVATGLYGRKNGGAWTLNLATTVVNDDQVQVRGTASATVSAQVDVQMTIGTVTAAFSIVTAGAGTRDWVPTDLGAKLLLWLRAEDLTGGDGDQIATWADSSGNGRTTAGAGASGKPLVKINALGTARAAQINGNSGPYFTVPAAALAGLSGAAGLEAFALVKLNGDPPSAYFGPPFGDFGTDQSGEYVPYVNGAFYSSFATNVRYGPMSETRPSLTSWRSLSFRSVTNDWRIYVDAALLHQETSNAFALGSSPRIGGAANNPLDGLMTDVVLTKGLTDLERQKLQGWMHWNRGLQAQLPNGHPYASAKPTI